MVNSIHSSNNAEKFMVLPILGQKFRENKQDNRAIHTTVPTQSWCRSSGLMTKCMFFLEILLKQTQKELWISYIMTYFQFLIDRDALSDVAGFRESEAKLKQNGLWQFSELN